MKNVNKIITIFILLFLIISLISNISISIIEQNVIGIIALRNIFIVLLIIFLYYNLKITTILLTFFCLFFWYNYFFNNQGEAYYFNVVIYYTNNIYEIIRCFYSNNIIHKTILNIPFISFVFISFFIAPIRIKKHSFR